MSSDGAGRLPPPRQLVRRAAVLGAGTMGAQIAALLASHGIPCDLLDLPSQDGGSQPAEAARSRLRTLKPSPIYSDDALDLIRTGNFDSDLPRLQQADWVIEAVVERLDVKRQLWGKAAAHLRPDAIASSNTSGIPIASIAEALPPELRRRFLGTHFFNPPRYLRLLEVIPTPQVDAPVVSAISSFAGTVLGKGVVIAHDVPGFIANRIGLYGLLVTFRAVEEFGLGPDEVDSVTGPAMGRPNSATFRTLDLVGLDVFLDICANLQESLSDAAERGAFRAPAYLDELSRRGWIGEKAGQGFYKRTEEGGQTQILTLDPATLEYRSRKRLQAPSLAAVRNVDDPAERLRTLAGADDPAGQFAWRTLSQMLVYSAQKVGEVAGDIASIDRAMRWGFGWSLGPFETWDLLGVAESVRRMEADGLAVPGWVAELAKAGQSFYRHEPEGSVQAAPQNPPSPPFRPPLLRGDSRGVGGFRYVPVPEGARTISLQRLRALGLRVAERPGATLYDLGEGVAFLDFHSPKQAIGPDMVEMLEVSARRVPQDFRGLVIGSHVEPNFCVGANLFLMLMAAREGEWEEIDHTVRRFQRAMLELKRLPVPVVAAPYGLTLGGGAEIALSAHRVAAAAECYMGLVETGAGLVPAGGGCKEMLVRALEGLPGGLAAQIGQGRARPTQLTPEADPNPALSRVFETIGLARVSGSALEARSLGFLRPADPVVPNPDQLLYVARETVCSLDAQGFAPPGPARVPVLGSGSRAFLELGAQHMVWGGYASEHDLTIARKLAYALTGGDRPAGSWADEQYFLDLEAEAFLSLCGEPKTQARMQHLLDTGRPLRN